MREENCTLETHLFDTAAEAGVLQTLDVILFLYFKGSTSHLNSLLAVGVFDGRRKARRHCAIIGCYSATQTLVNYAKKQYKMR